MDPTTCYFSMRDAMNEGDLDRACNLMVDLYQWLIKGGFYPLGVNQETVWDYLAFVNAKTQSVALD
jgi:hypothetical protein